MADPVACVIGWPVAHSRSPVIHRFWLRELGIPGDYVLQPIEREDIDAFLADFAASGYVGANVTVPHKQAAFAAATRRDAAAEATGAANTLWLEGGRLAATNTDPAGFLANLDDATPGWDKHQPSSAIVLGAGGAARGVVWALLSRGFAPVHVLNRTMSRGEEIAHDFGSAVMAAGLPELDSLLPDAAIVVNATSLGMKGQPPLEIDLSALAPHAVVNDLVYVPLETGLLKTARGRGARVADGLGMLLHQAAPGFEKWFGQRPQVTQALREEVLASMGAG